jgi:bis(5'-nucleosidyl)-tetraphosphatase
LSADLPVPQAGAIVYRRSDKALEVLLVKARKDPRIWIFPKGHIESGERADEAALREAREEAGVVGEIGRRVGALEFHNGKKLVHVEYFLVRWTSHVPAEDDRERLWCSFQEAESLIAFDNARLLLASARATLES